jgi:hypothetical protein
MSVGAKAFCHELQQVCVDCDVSRHPFYQRWTMAALGDDELARYVSQYRYELAATAQLAEAAASLAPDRGLWHELEIHAANARRRVEQWRVVADLLGQNCDAPPTKLSRDCVGIWAAQGMRSFIRTVTNLTVLQTTEIRVAPVLEEAVSVEFGIDIAWALEFFRRGESDLAMHLDHCKDVIGLHTRPQIEAGLLDRARRVVRARWALMDDLVEQ